MTTVSPGSVPPSVADGGVDSAASNSEEPDRPTLAPEGTAGITERSTPGGRPTALDRVDALWALLITAVYALLTLPRIADRAVWVDEAFTVGATHELMATWRNTGGTMALYYLLVAPVVRLSPDRFWLRFPSVVFALATIAVVYLLAKRIGGRSQAMVASAVLATTWAMARWGTEARGYSLATMLVAVSWLALVSATTAVEGRSRRRWWLIYAVAIVAAPLAHGLAALQFPAQIIALLLRPDRRRWMRSAAAVAAALAIEGALLFAIGAGDVATWVKPLRGPDLRAVGRVLFGRHLSFYVVGVLVVVGTVVAVVGLWTGRRKQVDRSDADPVAMAHRWMATVPVLWAWGLPVAILAISFVRPYQEPRYFTSSLPGVALVVSAVLVRFRRPLVVGALTLVVVALLLQDQPAVTAGGENWPGLVHQVAADATPGDLVLSDELARAPFDYAYDELDRPPALQPLSPVEPVGPVRRLYQLAPGSVTDQLLDVGGHDVWWVIRRSPNLEQAERVLADPEVAVRYRVVGRWEYKRALTLLHLVPRPIPARP